MERLFTLSRSSRLYKFVFGRHEGKLEGFPEPRNERISSGLFVGLLAAMSVMKPLAFAMMLLMEAMMKIVGFLIDGSYVRGDFPTKLEIIKIEPWPRLFDRRLSPWIVLAVGVVAYLYWQFGLEDAGMFLLFFTFTTTVWLTIDPEDKSPAMQLTEAVSPKVDDKLRLAYYREPKLFPALRFVD